MAAECRYYGSIQTYPHVKSHCTESPHLVMWLVKLCSLSPQSDVQEICPSGQRSSPALSSTTHALSAQEASRSFSEEAGGGRPPLAPLVSSPLVKCDAEQLLMNFLKKRFPLELRDT